MDEPQGRRLLRWVVHEGEGRRAQAVRWARSAADLARTEGLPVTLTELGPGTGVDDWSQFDVNVALGDDPVSTRAWWPAATAGVPSLLPSVPGAGDVVREAVLLGAAALVAEPGDPAAVLAAVRALAAVDREDVAAARALVALRASGEELDTRPRVVVVALSPRALGAATRACGLVADVGGVCHLVVHSGVVPQGWREPADAASVTYVDDAMTSSLLARLERRLLLTAPDSAEHLVRRLVKAFRAVGPAAARPLLDAAEARTSGAAGRWRRAGSRVHEAVWQPVSERLRPWLVGRSAAAALREDAPLGRTEIDVVATTEAESHALVWRLLRQHPEAVQRRLVTEQVLAEVVRRRASQAL